MTELVTRITVLVASLADVARNLMDLRAAVKHFSLKLETVIGMARTDSAHFVSGEMRHYLV